MVGRPGGSLTCRAKDARPRPQIDVGPHGTGWSNTSRYLRTFQPGAFCIKLSNCSHVIFRPVFLFLGTHLTPCCETCSSPSLARSPLTGNSTLSPQVSSQLRVRIRTRWVATIISLPVGNYSEIATSPLTIGKMGFNREGLIRRRVRRLTPSGQRFALSKTALQFCRTEGFSSAIPLSPSQRKRAHKGPLSLTGGEGGIRTLDTALDRITV